MLPDQVHLEHVQVASQGTGDSPIPPGQLSHRTSEHHAQYLSPSPPRQPVHSATLSQLRWQCISSSVHVNASRPSSALEHPPRVEAKDSATVRTHRAAPPCEHRSFGLLPIPCP